VGGLEALDSYGSKCASIGNIVRSRLPSSIMGLLRSRQQKCGSSGRVRDVQISPSKEHTIFRVHVDIARCWIRYDLPRLTGLLLGA
jgi:hypothetical protein